MYCNKIDINKKVKLRKYAFLLLKVRANLYKIRAGLSLYKVY